MRARRARDLARGSGFGRAARGITHLEVLLGELVDDFDRNLGGELAQQQQRLGVDLLLADEPGGVQLVEALGHDGSEHLQRLRELVDGARSGVLLGGGLGRLVLGGGLGRLGRGRLGVGGVGGINPSLLRVGRILGVIVLLALALGAGSFRFGRHVARVCR